MRGFFYLYGFYFNLNVNVNVKTPVIKLLFHHRDNENTEKNREGVLYHDKHSLRRVGKHISG